MRLLKSKNVQSAASRKPLPCPPLLSLYSKPHYLPRGCSLCLVTSCLQTFLPRHVSNLVPTTWWHSSVAALMQRQLYGDTNKQRTADRSKTASCKHVGSFGEKWYSDLEWCFMLILISTATPCVGGKIALIAHARRSFPPTLSSCKAGALCNAEPVAWSQRTVGT